MDITAVINYFNGLHNNGSPVAKLFKTKSHNYLYDTGTNKILNCSTEAFLLLQGILYNTAGTIVNQSVSKFGTNNTINAADNIIKSIKKENILLAKRPLAFGLSLHFHNYNELINHSLSQIVLEVTENCNYRCSYCVYNTTRCDMRNHSKRNMPISIGFSAIDYLKNHSLKNDDIYISFYGGEPLLQFNFIESCVEYTKMNIRNKNVHFAITTNASLLTPQIAKYFLNNNFGVTVSIDGPEDIHNEYRVDTKGNGTFDKTMKGLRNLYREYKEKFSNKISINIVYSPPYSETKLEIIADFFNKLNFISQDQRFHITYPNPGTILEDTRPNISHQEDKDLFEWSKEIFIDENILRNKKNPIASNSIEKNLALILKRPISNDPLSEYSLNGCCIPGQRRLHVSVDGTLRLCERVDYNAPPIGNIHSGIDLDVIKKIYIDEYAKLSLPDCSKCWAIQMCKACYVEVYTSGKMDVIKKKKLCASLLYSQEKYLKLFCELLEKNPNALDYLLEYEIK